MTHICVSKQTIIGSDNGLSPGRRQAIIWTNAEILLIGTLGTNFSEILIEIRIFSFKKMGLKMSSAKWRPFCLGRNVLMNQSPVKDQKQVEMTAIIDAFWAIFVVQILHGCPWQMNKTLMPSYLKLTSDSEIIW